MPEIHVQVDLATRFPSPDDLALRRDLIAAIQRAGGRVGDTGAGGGVMDLWVGVEDPASGLQGIERMVELLGIAHRTRVEVRKPMVCASIDCADDGFTPDEAIAAGDELAQAVVERNLGTFNAIGELPGRVDVTFRVDNPDVAVPAIEALVENLGLGERTTIDCF